MNWKWWIPVYGVRLLREELAAQQREASAKLAAAHQEVNYWRNYAQNTETIVYSITREPARQYLKKAAELCAEELALPLKKHFDIYLAKRIMELETPIRRFGSKKIYSFSIELPRLAYSVTIADVDLGAPIE